MKLKIEVVGATKKQIDYVGFRLREFVEDLGLVPTEYEILPEFAGVKLTLEEVSSEPEEG